MNLDDVNGLEETADYLHVSIAKLRLMARDREIGHIKTGRTYLFPRAAIEEWVRTHTVTPLPPEVPSWGLSEGSVRRLRQRHARAQGASSGNLAENAEPGRTRQPPGVDPL